ncbi:MAG: 23S rRNA (adenine(2503)-C(2))-methyltransferase RlmN [Candidatus Pacebacteria bacterium]|nr:23S rRNA (adenine(2503)-C(2))-methyltransferase RlmN [Candidatus Paceibacterota bacterium]
MELEKILSNEPAFRVEQAQKAIFQDSISNWDKASNLPKTLRDKLNKELPLEIKADVLVSAKSNSVKIALLLKDGLKAEAVLMKHKAKGSEQSRRERNTVCVSSQVGCSMGCLFCLTGKSGLKRSLTAWEIIQQVLFFERLLKLEDSEQDRKACPERSRRITNIVFMGMGEPLLNYDNVIEAINILNNKNCFNISMRKISISTVGIPWAIKKLAKEKIKPVSNASGVANAGWPNLAFSLHTANQTLRAKLMPIAKNHDLTELSRAIDFYIKQTNQRIIFEYLMLKGINDSEKDAFDLAVFVKQFKAPVNFRAGKNFYFVNLIAYNDFKSQDILEFKPSSKEKIAMFKEILKKQGVDAVQRYKFGEDIKGACGQLAHNIKHET